VRGAARVFIDEGPSLPRSLDLHPTFFLANRGGFFAAALTIAVEFF
jgi:hypothetical protein